MHGSSPPVQPVRGDTLTDLFNINIPPVSSIRVLSLASARWLSRGLLQRARACPGRRTARGCGLPRPIGQSAARAALAGHADLVVFRQSAGTCASHRATRGPQAYSRRSGRASCGASPCRDLCSRQWRCPLLHGLWRARPVQSTRPFGPVWPDRWRWRRAALSAVWCRQGLQWRVNWSRPVALAVGF